MLNIILMQQNTDRTVYDIDAYFNSAWEDSWIDNDFAKMVISKVDKSTVIAPKIIDSPFLGPIDPTHISGGVKCILCLMFDEEVNTRLFDITVCGNNCAQWIQRVGVIRDITVQLGYPMRFFQEFKSPIRIVNEDIIVNNHSEFLDVYVRHCI